MDITVDTGKTSAGNQGLAGKLSVTYLDSESEQNVNSVYFYLGKDIL